MADSKIILSKDLMDKVVEELTEYRAIGTVEELKLLQTFKELYDAYNVIGTIAEFRDLKANKNFEPIATIVLSKEDMQKIVDEKVAQIKLDVQEIRNKAIDEFVANAEEWNNNIKSIRNEEAFFTIEDIRKVAEQLKGE